MLSFYFVNLALLLVLPMAYSFPLEDAGSPSGFRVAVRSTRDAKTFPVTGFGNITLFDPTYAVRERHNLLGKYAQASRILSGLGLNPDTHPEADYPPFQAPTIADVARKFGRIARAAADRPENASTVSVTASGLLEVPGMAQPPSPPPMLKMKLTDYIGGDGTDVLYYGPMDFGSPAQELTIDIDTGSADLWVPARCVSCERNQRRQFRPSKSATYQESGEECTLSYADGEISGVVANDVVSVGGASVQNQTFCAIQHLEGNFRDEPQSGLLGLAFRSISKMNASNFFENLLQEHAVTESIFSVHLTRGQETGSEVCFGCYDPTKAMGQVEWQPLTSKTYWSVKLDGLDVNSTQVPANNVTAAIDTGTSFIYLPQDLAAAVYSKIPRGADASRMYGSGFFTFACDAQVTVSLTFGGMSFAIHSDDFNLGQVSPQNPKDCVGGIISMTDDGFPPNLAIIGGEFLKSWYSVYDVSGRVGFAPSINNHEQ